MKVIYGLLAAGLIALGACSIPVEVVSVHKDWYQACKYTEMIGYENACRDVDIPNVVYSDKLLMEIVGPGGLGFFIPGENTVYVSIGAAEEFDRDYRKTVVHEMVHYILDQSYPNVGRCESEQAARMAADLAFGDRYTNEWRGRYRC